jgi:hypothetical protein
MIEVVEDLQRLADNRVAFCTLDMGDKAHAARIVLVAGIVKPLGRRVSHRLHSSNRAQIPDPIRARGHAKQRKCGNFPLHLLPHHAAFVAWKSPMTTGSCFCNCEKGDTWLRRAEPRGE